MKKQLLEPANQARFLSSRSKRATFLATALIYSMAMGAPSAAQTSAYVTNRTDNTVSVIDISTNTVTATIPVGTNPFRPAATPDGTRVYVVNSGSNDVSVIDTASNTVTATVPVGSRPFGIAISPDGAHAYVTDNLGNTVSVIDTATNVVSATISVGNGPNGAAVTPDGARLYVANSFGGNISVIDTGTNTVIATVPSISNPIGVAIHPDGSRVYVTNAHGDVSVITTATNSVTTTLPVEFPQEIAITPNGERAYVTSGASVYVIDTATNTLTSTIFPIGTSPFNTAFGIAITADGNRAYIANGGNSSGVTNDVSVIDTTTNSQIATVPVGNWPQGVAIVKRSTTPPVSGTLKYFLHGNDIPKTAGGFTMNDTPGPSQTLGISLLSSVKWFSDPALSGAFASDTTFKLTFPCTVGVGVLTTFKLESTEPNGSSAQPLGQTTELLSVCVGSRTIPIPVNMPVTLTGKRLKLTIQNLLGLNLNLQLGSGTYLEATKFTSTP